MIILTVWIRKLGRRDVTWFAQGCTACKLWKPDLSWGWVTRAHALNLQRRGGEDKGDRALRAHCGLVLREGSLSRTGQELQSKRWKPEATARSKRVWEISSCVGCRAQPERASQGLLPTPLVWEQTGQQLNIACAQGRWEHCRQRWAAFLSEDFEKVAKEAQDQGRD